jgi:hypothetical protein
MVVFPLYPYCLSACCLHFYPEEDEATWFLQNIATHISKYNKLWLSGIQASGILN